MNEEVFVVQSKGFIDPVHPQHVYKLHKALRGLKQAIRAWYNRLVVFLSQQGYSRGGADHTLFIKKSSMDFMVA